MLLPFQHWRAIRSLLACAAVLLAGCERPAGSETESAASMANALPVAAVASQSPDTQHAREIYRNTPVLGELPRAEFDRTMQAITQWVAPKAGCMHCHVEGDMASDAKPAKQTARQMLQMVQHLNANWKPHLGSEGVTCQTCHQGATRPPRHWLTGDPAQQADAQYALMLHFSESLAADCSVCHAKPGAPGTAWGTAEPQVAQRERLHQMAKNGLRLVQNINAQHLALIDPRAQPAATRSVASAGAAVAGQVDCATCHQGSRKPPSDGAPRARDYAALTLVPTERSPGGDSASDLQSASATGQSRCNSVAEQAARLGSRIPLEVGLRPLLGNAVLALFAAPDSACAMLDLRVQPGDTVEAYVSHVGYTSVRYRRAATGSEASGWVRSDRLGPPVDRAAFAHSGNGAASASAASGAPAVAGLLAAADDCSGADTAADSAVSLRARRQVLGTGRLQFYSAPHEGCPLRGVFILPGEPVVALLQASRFTAVHYVNPRTGGQASGWVRSDRLGGG